MTISNQASGIRPGVCSSTTRPTAPFTGQIIYETDTGYLRVWDGANWDYLSQSQDTTTNIKASDIGSSWLTWTPVLSQGTTTFGISIVGGTARYSQINKVVIAKAYVQVTSGTGQLSQAFRCTLPVPNNGSDGVFGNAWIYDSSSATAYNAINLWLDANRVVFAGDWSGGGTFGIVPAIQVTTNDYINLLCIYEAA